MLVSSFVVLTITLGAGCNFSSCSKIFVVVVVKKGKQRFFLAWFLPQSDSLVEHSKSHSNENKNKVTSCSLGKIVHSFSSLEYL